MIAFLPEKTVQDREIRRNGKGVIGVPRPLVPLRAAVYCCVALLLFIVNIFGAPADSVHRRNVVIDHIDTVKKSQGAPLSGKDSIVTGQARDTVKKQQDLKDTVHYEADKIEYDAEQRILQLSGNSKIGYQNMTLVADTIIYTMNDDLFTAMGKPELIEDKDTTVGDFMAYNIKTRRGRVRYATTHVQDAYFSGQKIIKTDKNELYVAQGEYTTCAFPDTPHYFFYGEKIKLLPNDKIVGKPMVLNIGGAPVFYLPYFIFPVEHNRKSGILTPVWGGNPAGGGFLDNLGYYWTPNDYVDLSASARVQEFSRYVLNLSSNYALKYWLTGGISGHYTLDNSNFTRNTREWMINYSHNQQLTPDGTAKLIGSGTLTSSNDFISRYSLNTSELSQQILSAKLSLSKQFPDIGATGSIDLSRSDDLRKNDITDQMPSVNFTLNSRPLFPLAEKAEGDTTAPDSAWYRSIYWNYSGHGNVYRRINDDPNLSPLPRPAAENNFDISMSKRIFKYFDIAPSFRAFASTFYGYADTAVLRYDTTRPITVIKLRDPATFKSDTAYKNDTLVSDSVTYFPDNYGNPDSLHYLTVKEPRKITAIHRTYDHDFANVASWSAELRASTRLYGVFPLHILNIEGIRHTLTPSITYGFKPRHDLDKTFFNPQINPVGAQREQQNLNFSLGNLFEGKTREPSTDSAAAPKMKSFSILDASLDASYNFEATGRKWSDLRAIAGTTYSFLHVGFESNFWLYDRANNLSWPLMRDYSISLSPGEFSAHGKLWDGDLLLLDSLRKPDPLRDQNAGMQSWRISISPGYSYSASRVSPVDLFVPEKRYQLAASADLAFTRNWKASWHASYNFVADQIVNNTINLSCDLECWSMQFSWDAGRLNPSFYFMINIKKIPDIKWEQRGN
jgi:lipopolysaccharide export system protein LptA